MNDDEAGSVCDLGSQDYRAIARLRLDDDRVVAAATAMTIAAAPASTMKLASIEDEELF